MLQQEEHAAWMKEWTWLPELTVDHQNFNSSTWPSRLSFSPYCARWRIQCWFECRSSNCLNNARRARRSFFTAAAKCDCDPEPVFSQWEERKAKGFNHFLVENYSFILTHKQFSFIYLLNKIILCSLLITLQALWRDSSMDGRIDGLIDMILLQVLL